MKIKNLIAMLALCLNVSQTTAVMPELHKAALNFTAALLIPRMLGPIISKYLSQNKPVYDQKTSDELRQILIKYADDQDSLDKIKQIEFRADNEPAALPKANIIIMRNDFSQELKTGILLHEMGHMQDSMLKYELIIALHSTLIGFIANKTKPFSLSRIAFAAYSAITNLLLYRLIERFAEIRADNFSIACLKKHQDHQSLQATADFFNDPKYLSDYQKLQQKYGFGAPLVQLFSDGHPPDHQRAEKFQLAAQEVRANISITA